MKRLIVIGLVLALPVLASEERTEISCRAKVANRSFDVTIDRDTLIMTAKTDNGFQYRGMTSYHYSPQVKFHSYTLHGSYYATELVLLVDPTKGDEMALCLKQNECYRCR